MGLHEDQPRPRGGGGKLLGHAGAAILLLRGGHDQHVAQRQDPPQPGQRRVRGTGGAPSTLGPGRGSGGIGRIGVGAIDENQVRQRRQILLDQIDLAGVHAQDFRRQPRTAEHRRAGRRRPAATRADQFRPRQGVDQRALARSRPP